MPRFRFHVIDEIDAPDEEGQNLPNVAAAHRLAIDYARDLACSAVREGRLDLRHRIDLEDDQGKLLVTVTFADVIELST
jgi:hypothetical protein